LKYKLLVHMRHFSQSSVQHYWARTFHQWSTMTWIDRRGLRRQLLEGLREIHRRGWMHRDITGANILLREVVQTSKKQCNELSTSCSSLLHSPHRSLCCCSSPSRQHSESTSWLHCKNHRKSASTSNKSVMQSRKSMNVLTSCSIAILPSRGRPQTPMRT
jgi:hypothetical protein